MNRLALIQRLRSKGVKDSAIATKLGISRQRVLQLAGRSGARTGPAGMSAAVRAEVVKLAATGMSYRKVAAAVGVGVASVWKVVNGERAGREKETE